MQQGNGRIKRPNRTLQARIDAIDARRSAKSKRIVAIHEAGHAVAHVIFGKRFRYVTIRGTLEYRGCLAVWKGTVYRSTPDQLEHNALSAIIGPFADQRARGKKLRLSAVADLDLATLNQTLNLRFHALHHQCGGQQHRKYAKAYSVYLAAVAAEFIETPDNWQQIEAVADALVEKHTLKEREVQDICFAMHDRTMEQHWTGGLPPPPLWMGFLRDFARHPYLKHRSEKSTKGT